MPDATGRSLAQWLEYIDQTHPETVALGLERVRVVADRMALRQPNALSVLIAGTNGKGSTAVALETLLLTDAGLRVGTTLSPHLSRFNERVRIQGQPVDDAVLCEAFSAIEAARSEITLTYFEFATLAALYCFAHARCDVVLLEVGLGGRLDAFNIVDADLAIITSIGFDHQAWLGDTLDAIGAEKAGILRSGQSAFFGPAMPSSVDEQAKVLALVPKRIGQELLVEQDAAGARLRLVDRPAEVSTPWLDDRGFVPANLGLAWAAGREVLQRLERSPLTPQVLSQWASSLAMPGRCEQRTALGCRWLLDVGHNPLAADYLAVRIPQLCGEEVLPVAVFGCLRDKPGAELVARLAGQIEQWVLVPTDGPRGQSSRALAAAVHGPTGPVHQASSIEQGLRMARTLAPPGGWVLVFGGFAVVGAAREWLDQSEG